MKTTIAQPFCDSVFQDIKAHVKQVRRLFDWPGIPYHDAHEPENVVNEEGALTGNKFNRWFFHRPPMLHALHHSPELLDFAHKTFGVAVKPSYVFLSMYGPEGVCPLHTDRPQCQFTIDLQINSDGEWPIYVDGQPHVLKDGQALCYSGTGQPHFRKPMAQDSNATKMDLAFFHFVPIDWMGKTD